MYKEGLQLRILIALLTVLSASTVVSAAPILSIDLAPTQYAPGQDLDLELKMVGAADLAAFNIDLVIATPSAAAGVDAWFEVPLPPGRYVFGAGPDNTAWFTATVDTVGALHFLNLSDFHDPDYDFVLDPVDTVAGVNDVVAVITLKTTPGMTGSLLISIDADTLELDTDGVDGVGRPVPIVGFDTLQQGASQAPPIEITEIPEPAVLSVLLLGAWSVAGRRFRK